MFVFSVYILLLITYLFIFYCLLLDSFLSEDDLLFLY